MPTIYQQPAYKIQVEAANQISAYNSDLIADSIKAQVDYSIFSKVKDLKDAFSVATIVKHRLHVCLTRATPAARSPESGGWDSS